MRRTKKFASLLLAMIMVFSLGITAFAEENTHTYEIYQIFTGDYSDGILSNVKWGTNGTGTEGKAVDSSILEELEDAANNTSDTAQLAVINKYAKLSTPLIQAVLPPGMRICLTATIW